MGIIRLIQVVCLVTFIFSAFMHCTTGHLGAPHPEQAAGNSWGWWFGFTFILWFALKSYRFVRGDK